MTRGKHNNRGQGSPSNFRGGSPRGNRGRGRGGGGDGGRGRGQTRGRGGKGGYIPATETDFVLQMWPQSMGLAQ